MKRLLTLLLVLLLSGCQADSRAGFLPNAAPAEAGQALDQGLDQGLDAQLGQLRDYITKEERQACMDLYEKLLPLRQKRLADNEYDWSDYEARLLGRLNKLYESYTIRYLGGDEEGFGYENPAEVPLAEFDVTDADMPQIKEIPDEGQQPQEDLSQMWTDMRAILPDDAFAEFSDFIVFTDGPDELVAYVLPADDAGTRWQIAADPEDAGDSDFFTETVLHEYFHYMTLNHRQVDYTREQTADTYNEYGMVSKQGSYLDDFYQAYWTEYLDDCLVSGDTYNFFLRHYDDFVTAYASTDPSEDICESFTFFILQDRTADPRQVWEQKLDFFYAYPELVDFRATVRENLGLPA